MPRNMLQRLKRHFLLEWVFKFKWKTSFTRTQYFSIQTLERENMKNLLWASDKACSPGLDSACWAHAASRECSVCLSLSIKTKQSCCGHVSLCLPPFPATLRTFQFEKWCFWREKAQHREDVMSVRTSLPDRSAVTEGRQQQRRSSGFLEVSRQKAQKKG